MAGTDSAGTDPAGTGSTGTRSTGAAEGRLDVRAAGIDDLAAITAIYGHAVLHGTGTFELDPPDATDMAARHARVVAGGYPYLVATDGQRLLGFAYAYAYRDRPAYRFTVEDSIYVAAETRGRGVGKALLRALIERTVSAGFRQMVAVIGDSANIGSIRLHQAAGFRMAGQIASCGWKAGGWLDVVLMQRALGNGDADDPSA